MKASLADLVPMPEPISVNDEQELFVRGLNMEEIVQLLMKHKEPLITFIQGIEKGVGGEIDKTNIEHLIVTSSDMVAEIIALAAGEPQLAAQAKLLPFKVQVIALMKVWDMTAPDLKSLAESLDRVAATLRVGKMITPPLEIQTPSEPSTTT